jgi:hypothetical protein
VSPTAPASTASAQPSQRSDQAAPGVAVARAASDRRRWRQRGRPFGVAAALPQVGRPPKRAGIVTLFERQGDGFEQLLLQRPRAVDDRRVSERMTKADAVGLDGHERDPLRRLDRCGAAKQCCLIRW